MKLLVIDTSATLRRIITSMLQQIGHQDITESADGHGLDLAMFDVIITDTALEDLSLMHKAIVTCDADQPAAVGAGQSLYKPFSADQLAAAIARLSEI